MPKPKSKKELLIESSKNMAELLSLIKNLPKEKRERDFPEGSLNRNVCDIIMHLHSWHLLFLNWYEVGMEGGQPNMPAEGYTWSTLPALNKKLWKENCDVELKEALKCLKSTHGKVMKKIEEHSNKELFTKKLYHWTGSTSLAAYLISNTSSHYAWAIKLIKKNTK